MFSLPLNKVLIDSISIYKIPIKIGIKINIVLIASCFYLLIFLLFIYSAVM